MSKDKGYSIVVKLGKKPKPIKLRMAAVQLRGVADRLVELAKAGEFEDKLP